MPKQNQFEPKRMQVWVEPETVERLDRYADVVKPTFGFRLTRGQAVMHLLSEAEKRYPTGSQPA